VGAGGADPAALPLATAGADAALRAARVAAVGGDLDRLGELAPLVAGDPLESYLAYWQASVRLHAPGGADDTLVRPFLARYTGTVLADRLRAEWLLVLAGRGELAEFDTERRRLASVDDPQLVCYTLLTRYVIDDGHRRESIVREARRYLALAGDPGGDGCSALADRLLDDGALPIWPRLQALVEHAQLVAVQKTALRLAPADAAEVNRLLVKPAAWLPGHNGEGGGAEHSLVLLALLAQARDGPEEAARWADALDGTFSAEERALVWGRIGRSAQWKLLPQAHDWFARGGELVGIGIDYVRANEVLEARARAALRRGSTLAGELPAAQPSSDAGNPAPSAGTATSASGPDWQDLRQTIAQMPPELQNESTWAYWNGQALLAQGHTEEGHAALRAIAGRFSFYGRLAAEQLNLPLELAPRPLPPDPLRVDELAQRPGFQRARKLFELGMRDEAMREWNWELRGMDDPSLHAAAELGRRMGVLDRMIASSERMHTVVDLAQRYPMPYAELMTATSAPLGMDPAWIYGLIRQESRFMEDIRSNAGAIGLMQLMPTTARYVARRIGFENYRNDRIADVGVNLRLGTEYLKMVLDDQDGQALLASAAYNAGPHRVRKWRAALARPLDGAIFVETIPINETRDYVKRVLFNTLVYGGLLQRPAVSLQALLGPVRPKALPGTELP
jgi:soluble lytic murein transglycosylase